MYYTQAEKEEEWETSETSQNYSGDSREEHPCDLLQNVMWTALLEVFINFNFSCVSIFLSFLCLSSRSLLSVLSVCSL